MDSANRIALGVVGAAVLLLVGLVGYSEFQRARDRAEVQAFVQGVSDQLQDSARQAQADQLEHQRRERAAQVWRQQQAEASRQADLRRRELASNERCVAGTVVKVDRSSYTQVLISGGVVRCSGRYRLR